MQVVLQATLERFNYADAVGWVLGRLALIVLLLVISHVVRAALRRVIPSLIKTAVLKSARGGDGAELAKRHVTLSIVVVKTTETILWIVLAFMTLSLLGLDISPILAGVGVAGIAIGFGAQSLVKDVLSGLFILLENQYGKGDVVKIAGVSGLVEDVNLRRTVIRDLDGAVHNIPNGEVRVSTNQTRDWSRVNVKLSLTYDEDLDRAMAVIDRVGQEMATDPAIGPLIVEAPKAVRVDAFEETGIAIRILGVTKPMKQWEVMGELRRRLKIACDAADIHLPGPHRGPSLPAQQAQ